MSKIKILRVETGFYVAGAIFEKRGKFWICTRAAPIIGWATGNTLKTVQKHLKNNRSKYLIYEVF